MENKINKKNKYLKNFFKSKHNFFPLFIFKSIYLILRLFLVTKEMPKPYTGKGIRQLEKVLRIHLPIEFAISLELSL